LEKFKSFITEEEVKPYRLLILIYKTSPDQTRTGALMTTKAKSMGIPIYEFEVNTGYTSVNKNGNLVMHNYSFEKDTHGKIIKDDNDKKGFEVKSEDTICLIRVTDNHPKAKRFGEEIRAHGITTINSAYTYMICDDKWLTYTVMKQNNINQPRTSIVGHEKLIENQVNDIGGKFPLILKTTNGAGGVGVMFVESEKTLLPTVQLIQSLDKGADIILQEYIKTSYDVRVMVLHNEIVATLKRPVIDSDFRSNISQGNEPEKVELSELEKSECLKAAKSVKGKWVGVDFIPSKNKENEPPYILEVNGSPGTLYINELNDIDIFKMFLESFKNRDNWS